MPNRGASILPIALCGLLLVAACGRGSARQAKAAVADSSAARTDASAVESLAERDSGEVTALLRSLSSELRIETTPPPTEAGPGDRVTTVQVDGRTMFADSGSYGVELFGWWDDPRMMVPEGRTPAAPLGQVALLRVVRDGSGCPALFRVVELMSDGSSAVTDEFGTCAEWPDAVWFDAGGAMRMRFGDYALASVRSEPGFREDPPTTWIYRTGGRLEEMKER
ncbi:MAG TPA: hypothetical protein VEQ60_01435 [Longimicrobium sp.]|nr:hypothetical protein [Longimicrobium sp.]